jgi:hypothetical protein
VETVLEEEKEEEKRERELMRYVQYWSLMLSGRVPDRTTQVASCCWTSGSSQAGRALSVISYVYCNMSADGTCVCSETEVRNLASIKWGFHGNQSERVVPSWSVSLCYGNQMQSVLQCTRLPKTGTSRLLPLSSYLLHSADFPDLLKLLVCIFSEVLISERRARAVTSKSGHMERLSVETAGRDGSCHILLFPLDFQRVYHCSYCVSGHPSTSFYLKHTTFLRLDSVSVFRWNLRSWR